MNEEISLQELILGYCRQVGGLVDPPAYGIHEVLLPDEAAASLGIAPHQRFIFPSELETSPAGGGVTLLYYGHPLVEVIVEELRRQAASGLFYINSVRLEKPGLYATIEKSLAVANARVFTAAGAVERRRLYHYVCFNFKASLISDEKRELILPVWMHLQGGYAVKEDEIKRLAILDSEPQFKHLNLADPTWATGRPLSIEVLQLLLDRASQAALRQLGPNLESLRTRLQHYLELDQARLSQYYDDLAKDAEKRLKNAIDDERRQTMYIKLAAIVSERQAKLADVEQKYHLRVDLELVNLAVIAQPKLDLAVEIKKRGASVVKQVVWDPLLHRVEPLVCDVCGLPGENLSICEEGHLAHTGCLAPQCVECKRTYCMKCSDRVQSCVVCDRAVCEHSLVRCPTCKRVTCHEHVGLCHAENGEPQRPHVEETPPATAVAVVTAAPTTEAEPPSGQPRAPKKASTKSKAPPARPVSKRNKVSPSVTGDYLEVYSDPALGTVEAYVMARKHAVAVRTWTLMEAGISVQCSCEKRMLCRENDIVYRPAPDTQLESQVKGFIHALRYEYAVPEKKTHYFQIRQGQVFEEPKLKLPSQWRDSETLAQARLGFDRLTEERSQKAGN
jgi:hypothetical protein